MLIALLRGGAGKAAATANAFNMDEVQPIKKKKIHSRNLSFKYKEKTHCTSNTVSHIAHLKLH